MAEQIGRRQRVTGEQLDEVEMPVRNVAGALISYSEWLDGEGLIIGDGTP